ncbi:class I SAM-dependent DNA methyltransferase [uncultured Hymenobacter sp.]|uniref:class I SAM-dependent DNA methyltransferase n=1 Tax=uncultured Hymenobacter sp. TaxID=170016 RepID=UPI0035CB8E9E
MVNPNQPRTLPPTYFDDVYRANEDPWGFESSPYEREKYAATLAALPLPAYAEAFEIGCSLGVLTAQLAPRCGHLLAVDVTEAPLAKARLRCANLPQVEFQLLRVPDEYPAQSFDLILLSEVGYYWSAADLAKAVGRLVTSLNPGGQLLLVHWTPPVHDYPLTGDDVHETFLQQAAPGGPLRHLAGQRQERYRLDLLEKKPAHQHS